MERGPTRRSFITAVGVAAAATALGPAKAGAATDQAGSAYRTAGELVPALASTVLRREPGPKGQRSWLLPPNDFRWKELLSGTVRPGE